MAHIAEAAKEFLTEKNGQIGGNHYAKTPMQPIEYILANNMGFCEANVVKYVSRHKDKGGLQDLLKAKHYIDLLIAHEYSEGE